MLNEDDLPKLAARSPTNINNLTRIQANLDFLLSCVPLIQVSDLYDYLDEVFIIQELTVVL